MSKRIALPAVVILIAMAVAGIVYVCKLSPVTVEVARVERDVEIRVFGLGSVEAQVLSRIGFQVAIEREAAVIVVTHDEKIFSRLDRMAHLRDGRIVDVVERPPA